MPLFNVTRTFCFTFSYAKMGLLMHYHNRHHWSIPEEGATDTGTQKLNLLSTSASTFKHLKQNLWMLQKTSYTKYLETWNKISYGSPVAPNYVNLFMGTFELDLIYNHNPYSKFIKIYWRYNLYLEWQCWWFKWVSCIHKFSEGIYKILIVMIWNAFCFWLFWGGRNQLTYWSISKELFRAVSYWGLDVFMTLMILLKHMLKDFQERKL